MSFAWLPLISMPLVLGFALLTGACGAPLAVTGASYAADGGVLLVSDKTTADHFASMVSKKDCALWRILRGRQICQEREGDLDPYNVDYNQPQRMVAEDGVHYAPPLRAAADAPATSWNDAAYKSAPPAATSAPVTAVADAAPDPAPVAAPSAAPKARKAKTRSVRKPSRDRAGPAS